MSLILKVIGKAFIICKSIYNEVPKIVSVLGAIPVIGAGYFWFYKKWNRPKIKWELFDCPLSNRADYLVQVNNKKSVKKIRLLLKPIGFSPKDYQISITNFFQYCGSEHMEKIELLQKNLEKYKEVYFDLPARGRFRLIITSNGGCTGSLLPQNLEKIDIQYSEAKICRKYHKYLNL